MRSDELAEIRRSIEHVTTYVTCGDLEPHLPHGMDAKWCGGLDRPTSRVLRLLGHIDALQRDLTQRTPYLTALAEAADEAIGNTANREGDAYQQGVRDLAAALAGLPSMPDQLGIGTLQDATEAMHVAAQP